MIIKNKSESFDTIEKLNLNTMPMIRCDNIDLNKVKEFLNKNGDLTYIIRDEIMKTKKVIRGLTKEEVLKNLNISKKYTIEVESINYKNNRKLYGDIKIGSDASLWFIGTSDGNVMGRDKYLDYEWNFKSDLFDPIIKTIPNIEKIIRYISDNNLFDIIIEFAYFDIKIGKNNEHTVIFELRTDF